jgi:hypothetical protein
MWQYVIVGATIFGLIVGLFSVYNGRATRKYIGELIKETRISTEKEINGTKELIKEGTKGSQELLEQYGKRTQELLEQHGKIFEKLSEQHITMINLLKPAK